MTSMYQYAGRAVVSLTLMAGAGCNTMPTVPPPEAILAGIWKIVPGSPQSFNAKFVTFNETGRVTKVETTSIDFLLRNVTVTESNLNLASMVNGASVKVTMPGDLSFAGTLNDARTEATGKLVTEANIFDTTITTELGPATMTRQ